MGEGGGGRGQSDWLEMPADAASAGCEGENKKDCAMMERSPYIAMIERIRTPLGRRTSRTKRGIEGGGA